MIEKQFIYDERTPSGHRVTISRKGELHIDGIPFGDPRCNEQVLRRGQVFHGIGGTKIESYSFNWFVCAGPDNAYPVLDDVFRRITQSDGKTWWDAPLAAVGVTA